MLHSAVVRIIVGLGLLALLLRPAASQTQPDVSLILKRVSATYRAVSQYELFANATEQSAGSAKGKPMRMHFAFRTPNKYRFEGVMPGRRSDDDDSEPDAMVMVHDGSTLWFYLPKTNQYGFFPATELTADAPGDLGDASPEQMDRTMVGRYRGAATFMEAKFLREEGIEFGRAKVACYVLTVSETKGGMAYTWWVDQQRYRILREDNAQSSSVFTSIKLDEPLSDDLFKFEPPPGARKVDPKQ